MIPYQRSLWTQNTVEDVCWYELLFTAQLKQLCILSSVTTYVR